LLTEVVTSAVNAGLMTALAQISATFIAITAGFYTTKITSITNDKSRINGRIKELATEYSIVEANSKTVQKKKNSINEVDAQENINTFITDLLSDSMLPSITIKTIDDLILIFEKFYKRTPSELERKIVEERLQEIIAKVLEEQNKRNLRRTVQTTRIPSGEEQIVRAMRSQNEQDIIIL
jgi:type III secretory pathway component EscV